MNITNSNGWACACGRWECVECTKRQYDNLAAEVADLKARLKAVRTSRHDPVRVALVANLRVKHWRKP